jgi:hypothetical protein
VESLNKSPRGPHWARKTTKCCLTQLRQLIRRGFANKTLNKSLSRSAAVCVLINLSFSRLSNSQNCHNSTSELSQFHCSFPFYLLSLFLNQKKARDHVGKRPIRTCFLTDVWQNCGVGSHHATAAEKENNSVWNVLVRTFGMPDSASPVPRNYRGTT